MIDDLGQTAPNKAAAVVEALPRGFPGHLTESVMTAIKGRSRLLADLEVNAIAAKGTV